MRRARTPALLLAAALLLAGCGASARAGDPTWLPKPSFSGEGPMGRVPAQLPPQGPGGGPSGGSATPRPGGPGAGPDPAVVATNLKAPVGLALLPDGTALVGERTTGRIVRVQPRPGQPVQLVRTLSGVDPAGDGGLLDLALSPTYEQDGLIFAYLTTRTDNRVVTFTLHGPMTPVLTGIPKGATDNTGRLLFGSDGNLYVGTGDAGRPALAADPHSLGGKVLRVTAIGTPAAGNPTPASAVLTSGHRVVDGLCLAGESNTVVEVEARGAGRSGTVNVLLPGDSYGWPAGGAAARGPVATMRSRQGAPGGCAVLNSTLYVTSRDGRMLLAGALTGAGQALSVAPLRPMLVGKYGRLRTVVAAPDGALWLTTANRDGSGTPVPTDDRVLRIFPAGPAGASFPG